MTLQRVGLIVSTAQLQNVGRLREIPPTDPSSCPRRACSRFFAWCDDRKLTLTTIRPFDVATYIETLGNTHSAPGVKQQLAAVRMLFDWLITGQVAPSNPASAVRGPTHVVKTGTTPVLEGKSGGG
jgi:site-specific recombinase XerD